MPKTLVAKSIPGINPMHFEVKDGVVQRLLLNVNVNYGELGITHQIDLFDDFSDTQKARAQKLYDDALAKATKRFLE